MVYPIFLVVSGVIIIVLLFFLERAFRKINELERILEDERRKSSMPRLTLEVKTDSDYGIFVINDSYCYAKNITARDLDVILDYGFKKHITLKFDPLDMLKPNGRKKLNYRVFDGDYEASGSDAQNILNHFADAPLQLQLRYENIEGAPFTATILCEKGQYIVKKIAAL
jgi:hypothetical protein